MKHFNETHGMSNSRTYGSWRAMLKRCENKNHHAYSRYGGRGILICESWHIFEIFLRDMGERPKDKTLDRIDSNGNYEPGNCRWADWKTQNNNRRRNGGGRVGVPVEINGISKSLIQWSRDNGIPMSTIYRRFNAGWPIEFVLSNQNHRNNSPLAKG